MLGLALSLMLVGQPDPSVCRADLVFSAAVEQFAAGRPGARPPEPFRSLIASLGADCYGCRQRASRRLAAASAADPRWLFWARRSRDPEVAFRSNIILIDLTRCGYCGGTGLCYEYRPKSEDGEGPCGVCGKWGWNHPESPGPCGPCGGAGSAWNKGSFE